MCRLCWRVAQWHGWGPKPGCKGHVLVPMDVCDTHKRTLVQRGLMQVEPLAAEAAR